MTNPVRLSTGPAISRLAELVFTKRAKLDDEVFPDICETPIDRIGEGIILSVVCRLEPTSFQMTPDNFGDVELRRIRGQKKEIQVSFFPDRALRLDNFGGVNAGVIENHDRWRGEGEG